MGHAEVDGLRLDLLRFRDAKLDGYPVAGPIIVDGRSPPDDGPGGHYLHPAGTGR